eukprot:COSAG02_NODE_221_length_28385_cov_5.795164_19_plen_202_part_00
MTLKHRPENIQPVQCNRQWQAARFFGSRSQFTQYRGKEMLFRHNSPTSLPSFLSTLRCIRRRVKSLPWIPIMRGIPSMSDQLIPRQLINPHGARRRCWGGWARAWPGGSMSHRQWRQRDHCRACPSPTPLRKKGPSTLVSDSPARERPAESRSPAARDPACTLPISFAFWTAAALLVHTDACHLQGLRWIRCPRTSSTTSG